MRSAACFSPSSQKAVRGVLKAYSLWSLGFSRGVSFKPNLYGVCSAWGGPGVGWKYIKAQSFLFCAVMRFLCTRLERLGGKTLRTGQEADGKGQLLEKVLEGNACWFWKAQTKVHNLVTGNSGSQTQLPIKIIWLPLGPGWSCDHSLGNQSFRCFLSTLWGFRWQTRILCRNVGLGTFKPRATYPRREGGCL